MNNQRPASWQNSLARPTSFAARSATARMVVALSQPPKGPCGRAQKAFTIGSAALISVRPERLRLEPGHASRSDADGIQGHICEVIYMGRLRKYVLDTVGGQKLIVARQVAGVEAKSFTVGDAVMATFVPEDAVVLQDTHEQGGN